MSMLGAVKGVVEAARAWCRSVNHFRRLVDAKKDPDSIEKARKQLVADARRLEQAVVAFERVNADSSSKGPKKSIPWAAVARGVLKGASAINSAIEGAEGKRVITVEGEVVTPPAQKT